MPNNMNEIHEWIGGSPDGRKLRSKLEAIGKTTLQLSDLGETFDLSYDTAPFWDKILDQTDFLRMINSRGIAGSIVKSNELTLGTNGEDILRPAVEATDPGDTVTMDTAERTFTAEEYIAVGAISDSAVESNRDGASFVDHFYGMLFRALGNEFENGLVNGFKVGTTNSQRGSITGCWDGFLQQINAAGTVLNATAYSTRVVHLPGDSSYAKTNDKHGIAVKSLPGKYYGAGPYAFYSTLGLCADAAMSLAGRQTQLGDEYTRQGFWPGVFVHGFPMMKVRKFRNNYVVKGTGGPKTTNPGSTQINGTGVSKARSTTSTVDAITNFANTDKVVVGADSSAGTAFQLNAEYLIQSGTPSGSTLTWTTAQAYDHADNEYVREFTTAPTVNGAAMLFADLSDFWLCYTRDLRIEFFREPRKRQTSFVLTGRAVPMVGNPNAHVLVRDMLES